MPVAYPEPIYVDGSWEVATPVGLPVYSSPIQSTTAEYVVNQDFMQSRSSFSPMPLNTGWFRDSSYKLVSEGPRQDIGGGMVKWTRTYARVPESHDEYESYSYPFIGYFGVWIAGNTSQQGAAAQTGRPREARICTSKVTHEYFLVGAGGVTVGTIPTITAQRYYSSDGVTDTDYLTDEVVVGSVTFLASVPSKTEYQGWVTASADGNFETGYPIVAEDSRISRWLGNLFVRQVRRVLPQ